MNKTGGFVKRMVAFLLAGILFFSDSLLFTDDIAAKTLENQSSESLVEDVFYDISAEDWYRDYVQNVYDNKLMTGMSQVIFSPLGIISRAQFVVILYRMEGEPHVDFQRCFSDVPSGQFYSDAVFWAVEKGIVTGFDPEHFGPAIPISREQIATMLHRYAKTKDADMSLAEDMSQFTDWNQVSSFAKDAMRWAVEQGILTGRDGKILAPIDYTPRAEIAAIVSRYMSMNDENGILLGDDFEMIFQENEDDTIGLALLNAENEVVYKNDTPAAIDIVTKDMKEEVTYLAGYEHVKKVQGDWQAEAVVDTLQGSRFHVVDIYAKCESGICMKRMIEVVKSEEADYGFASSFSVVTENENASEEDFEYFIPSLFYKETDGLASYALFRSLPKDGAVVLAKETRTGHPLMMIRSKESGDMISFTHIADDIADSDAVKKQYDVYRCDSACQYGAVGITNEKNPGILFRYPYAETPGSYTTGQKGQHSYHPIEVGQTDTYTIFLYADNNADYNEAMISCYKESFAVTDLKIADIDLNDMYETAQEDMKDYVQEKGYGIGLPFAAYVDDGSIFIDAGGNEAVNFQMGFIGMQIPLAYQMMRYGANYGDEEAWDNGIAIMNFWSESCKTDSGVVKVWFDTYGFRPYPAFLRIMTDGMEGMLDAWKLAQIDTDPSAHVKEWEDMIIRYADFLVRAQNQDGSFYRAYDYSGNAFSDANADGLIGDANTQGSSKLNSAVPVRFLIRMYEAFGKEEYLEAAKDAGAYVIKELYPSGKYVGGTADNPNTVDKEAGMYAMYAYSALYHATGDVKYLEAMEQAAIYTFSWIYTYKFSAANPKGIPAGIPSSMGLNDGLSFIATGHSGVDNMAAYMYYEYFKLYAWTEDPIYLEMADFIQNNSRQTMDLNGDFGYAKRSFMIEATGIADMVFGTAGDRGIWLPWITCANIEPAANMEDTFGTMYVRKAANDSFEKLRLEIQNHGA